VYQHLLRQESELFRGFFRGFLAYGSGDGFEGDIVFPDLDADIFRLFVNWLYHNALTTREWSRIIRGSHQAVSSHAEIGGFGFSELSCGQHHCTFPHSKWRGTRRPTEEIYRATSPDHL